MENIPDFTSGKKALKCNDVHGLWFNNYSSGNTHATISSKEYNRKIIGTYVEPVVSSSIHMYVRGNRRKGIAKIAKYKGNPFFLSRVPEAPCINGFMSRSRTLSFCRQRLCKNNRQIKYKSPIRAYSSYDSSFYHSQFVCNFNYQCCPNRTGVRKIAKLDVVITKACKNA